MKVTETKDGTVTIDTGSRGTAKATWDGETISTRLVKAIAEERFTLNLIYPADKADVAKAIDGHRDFASKAVVRKAAHDFIRNHGRVGTFHTAYTGQGIEEGAADMVQNFIWPDEVPDWAIKCVDGSEVIIKSGDWLGGFIWTPDWWELVKAGQLNGISPEGKVKRRKPSQAAVAALRS